MKIFLKKLRPATVTIGFAAAALLILWGLQGGRAEAQQTGQVQLPGSAIPQFVDRLPDLSVIGVGGPMTVLNGTSPLTITMREFKAHVLPTGTFTPGVKPETWVWGYISGDAPSAPLETYIGPVIIAQRGTPTQVTWVNALRTTGTSQLLAWKNSTDQTLHWADPKGEMGSTAHYAGPIPAVVHLHGGEVPPEIDGGPDAWFLSSPAAGYTSHGHAYYSSATDANSATYNYPNTQEAANIWFHDHVLGATRLNVYAGLAGAYVIMDDENDPKGLAGPIVPLVIQDRSFDTNGQLLMPNLPTNPTIHPYWTPEFVGDTIVVNGKVWPYFNVQPKRYRFLFLNGSNARTYEMFLVDPVSKVMGPPLYAIGTDGGYLDAPVKIDPNAPKGQMQRLTMMPGERYDVIIDFSGVAPGTNLILRNVAKTPFPAGTAPQGSTVGRIMQFRVTAAADGYAPGTFDPTVAGVTLRGGTGQGPAIVRLVDPATGAALVTPSPIRQLTLNEVMGLGGPLEILVNNTKWDGLSVDTDNFTNGIRSDFVLKTVNGVDTYYSELPQEGTTELWEIVNLTADAHPIHLHLVQFQLMNRQNFNTNKYNRAYNALFPATTTVLDPMTGLPFPGGVFIGGYGPPLNYSMGNPRALGGNPDITPYLQGPVRPPDPNEAGWKDTVIMYPGQVTRIMVRWAPTSLPTTSPAAELFFPFDPSDFLGHGYVWHCHIIDHEDNEMMRPDAVILNPAAPLPGSRPLRQGYEY